MAALGALIAGDLPPAGNPISLHRRAAAPQFADHHTEWLNSGTAALALALTLARRAHPQIAQPEVVLPGYACPDLVAAAVFAGVKPVLADIGFDDAAYDLDALRQALSERTVAVVAVNFLGIKERLADIRALLAGADIALIEDNAQWFPEPLSQPALNGDLVCLSFGRGKPVSLLGGGAVLMQRRYAELLQAPDIQSALPPGKAFVAKVLAYNALLQPQLYGLLSRNPLLKLGQTTLKQLAGVRAIDPLRRDLLAANIKNYLSLPRSTERAVQTLVASQSSLLDWAGIAGARAGRLLRYPLLCRDRHQRDALWAQLRAAGLGATAMYQRVLPEIEGVAALVQCRDDLRGARAFADRLLTLPVHSGVRPRHLAALEKLLQQL